VDKKRKKSIYIIRTILGKTKEKMIENILKEVQDA